MKRQASESFPTGPQHDIRWKIFAKGRRRRPSGLGQRVREMAQAASASGAKTPTTKAR